MTVKELIALLENVENKDQQIHVAVGQSNKAYPVAYCTPWNTDWLRQGPSGVEINIALPDGMYTVQRKTS